MATREELAKERRLTTAEMDEVIERASKLQEGLGKTGRSVEELKSVGKELDIAPEHIDRAIAEIEREKAAAAAEATRAKAGRARALKLAGAALALVVAIAGLGSGGVRGAAADAGAARANLETVLSRQTALVPQLVALSGGDVSALEAAVAAVESAKDVEAKTRAADRLQLELAKVVGALPADPAKADQRLALQHELVGATNRVAVERRRYEEALASWRAAAGGPVARVGVALGFAPAPP